jgi:hypothetical protein
MWRVEPAKLFDASCYSEAMSDKEQPYHIQAIYDLQADYSPEHSGMLSANAVNSLLR